MPLKKRLQSDDAAPFRKQLDLKLFMLLCYVRTLTPAQIMCFMFNERVRAVRHYNEFKQKAPEYAQKFEQRRAEYYTRSEAANIRKETRKQKILKYGQRRCRLKEVYNSDEDSTAARSASDIDSDASREGHNVSDAGNHHGDIGTDSESDAALPLRLEVAEVAAVAAVAAPAAAHPSDAHEPCPSPSQESRSPGPESEYNSDADASYQPSTVNPTSDDESDGEPEDGADEIPGSHADLSDAAHSEHADEPAEVKVDWGRSAHRCACVYCCLQFLIHGKL
jgi:hypothetical protein